MALETVDANDRAGDGAGDRRQLAPHEQEQLQGRQTHDEEQPPSINNPMHARPSSASARSAGSPGEQAPARSFATSGGPQTHISEKEGPKEEEESVRASVHS